MVKVRSCKVMGVDSTDLQYSPGRRRKKKAIHAMSATARLKGSCVRTAVM